MSPPPIPPDPPPPSPAEEKRTDAGDQAGTAPPKGEMLEQGTQASSASPPPPAAAPATMIHEGAVYRTPDGEERLVWVVRHGVVEYFARRAAARWTPTLLDRGTPSVDDFARQVGMLAPG